MLTFVWYKLDMAPKKDSKLNQNFRRYSRNLFKKQVGDLDGWIKENKKDITEIKSSYLKGLKFHYLSNMKEVTDIAIAQ